MEGLWRLDMSVVAQMADKAKPYSEASLAVWTEGGGDVC